MRVWAAVVIDLRTLIMGRLFKEQVPPGQTEAVSGPAELPDEVPDPAVGVTS